MAMVTDSFLILLEESDLSAGKPIPWSIYDQDEAVLWPEGHVFASQDEIVDAVNTVIFRREGGEPEVQDKIEIKGKHELQDKEAELDHAFSDRASPSNKTQRSKFEEMGARVGDVLLLQVMGPFRDERCKVKLIGYAVGRTIIIEAPSGASDHIAVHADQEVIVRSFSGKNAYGFWTTVNKASKLPFPYLHLNYPEYVDKVSVRESSRIPFNVIGMASRVKDEVVGDRISVLIVDFSTTGAAFVAPKGAVGRGDILRIAFRVKIQDIEVLPIVDSIIRSEAPIEGDANGKYRYGVQFKDLKTQDLLVLQSMVYQKMLEQA